VHDDAPNVEPGQPTTIDINSVVLTGYLVAEPQAQPTHDGHSLTLLRLAFRRSDAIDYIDVLVTAPDQAELANQLTRGQRLLITGQLTQQRWKNRRGTTRCKHAIVGSSLEPTPRPPAPSELRPPSAG
jgi:single-stranded DNA-binding protein